MITILTKEERLLCTGSCLDTPCCIRSFVIDSLTLLSIGATIFIAYLRQQQTTYIGNEHPLQQGVTRLVPQTDSTGETRWVTAPSDPPSPPNTHQRHG